MAKKKNNKKVKAVKKMQDKSPEIGEVVEDTVPPVDQKDGNAEDKNIDDENNEDVVESSSVNTSKGSIPVADSEESGQRTYETKLNSDAKDVMSLDKSAGITDTAQHSIEGESPRLVEKTLRKPAAASEDIGGTDAEVSGILDSGVPPDSIVESSKDDELNEIDLNESLIEVPADSSKVAEVHVGSEEPEQYNQQLKTLPSNNINDADQSLKNETSKIEKAIDGYSSPPLPPRDHKATADVLETLPSTPSGEQETTPAASQSPISPPLPPRHSKNRPQRAVPPPLSEEMQSEEFRKNLALANAPTPPPKQPEVRKVKQLDSGAEINLIINRFRQTSHHYQRQDEASRENLERGKDFLKSSYSTFLESLEPTSPMKSITSKEHDDITAEAVELQDDEIELIKVDWAFWTQVVNDFPSVANYPEKLEQKITDGIPPQIRGIIWQLIANSKSKEFEDIYNTLLHSESPHEAIIRRDLKRTKYIPEDKIEDLFNIMKVYSVYDPDVGYTQGMAFIATPLLLNCESEAEAFGLLIRLMKSYGLRDLFLPDMPGLMLLLYQFDRLFEENSPQLYNHLTRQGVRSSMYATQWFLTFFAYKFPLGFVLRIYDIVFVEGIESILRFAVNLMLKNEKFLLELNFDKLLDFLKNQLFGYYSKDSIEERNLEKELEQYTDDNGHPDGSDANSVLKKKLTSTSQVIAEKGEPSTEISDEDYDIEMFVHDAMNDVHVTPISLKRYAAEYDEIHEIEQQKEAQYESIRIKNHQLQKEVRKLEHDYTLLNREHVEIANELIKNRLKIETLIDENKDQKLGILDLKRRLEEEVRKQELPNPDSSIPSDLKQDLDRTIKRNAEVMSENLRLQDKIGEQERIISELKAANRAGAAATFQPSLKPPLANGWSGLKKVFK